MFGEKGGRETSAKSRDSTATARAVAAVEINLAEFSTASGTLLGATQRRRRKHGFMCHITPLGKENADAAVIR